MTDASPAPLFCARSVLDKERFCREVLDVKLNQAQRLMMAAGPHDGPKPGARVRVCSFGARTGKSFAASVELVCSAIAPTPRQCEYWCVGPVHHLAARVWDRVVQFFREKLPDHIISVKVNQGELRIRNLAGFEVLITRKSADRPGTLVGAGCDGIVIDEAARVDDEAFENGIQTRIIDGRSGWLLLISTPVGTSGFFARLLRQGLRRESPAEIWGACLSTWANEFVPRKELWRCNKTMDPVTYKQEILGELVAAAGKVFDPESLEACAVLPAWQEPEPGACYVAGLDLALSQDATVLTIAKQRADGKAEVVRIDRWMKLPWPAQCERIARLIRAYNNAQIAMDASGLGSPVLAMLQEHGLFPRAEVLQTRRKVELVRNMDLILSHGRVLLPNRTLCPQLHNELESFEYADEHDHQKMSAVSGSHDDAVISLALALSFFHAGEGEECRWFVNGRSGSTRKRDDVEEKDEPVQDPSGITVSGLAVPEEDDDARVWTSKSPRIVTLRDLPYEGLGGSLFP